LTSLQFGGARTYTAFIYDATERKLARDRLKIFRSVFDASAQCVGISDHRGKSVYQNHAQELELGYSEDEVLGMHFSHFIPEGDREHFTQQIGSLGSRRAWSGQLPVRRKDGSTFVSFSTIGFIRDADGEVQYSFNIYTNFSGELERRAELALAKEEAERANQAKSDFLSSMSHELRTPMNAILGFAQMLEYDINLNADQQDNVQEILKAGNHLLELINEVLDLAKIESGKTDMSMEDVRLSSLLSECGDLIKPLAQARDIALAIQVPSEWAVRADRTKLKQALINLLSNAVKYNRWAGEIAVTVAADAQDTLRIDVQDTGEGIAAEQMEKLFQPFSRLGSQSSQVQGTGIGLTITRRLVELMGGHVGVHSKPGEGSTFWITLPHVHCVELQEDAIEVPYKTQPLALERSYHVLSVDDHATNLRLIETILARRPNVRVTSALTPEQGIEFALADRPDLILLDINMPDMDGYQVLGILKADPRLRSVPIVALTANAMARDVERGLQAGFAQYLTKPVDVRVLLKTLDDCLQQREAVTP